MCPQSQFVIAVLFAFGFAVHCLFAASNAVRDKRVPTTQAWFVAVWCTVLVRFVLTLLLFLIYAGNQVLFDRLLAFTSFNAQISLPVTRVTACLLGYFADSILDLIAKMPKLAWLSREIPQY